MWVLGTFRLFILAFHTPHLKSNSMIFWKEFSILKERASLLPIIFAPSGRMIGRQRGTRTSPVVSFVSLLTFLLTTSTFVLEALFSSRLLVYQWAPTVKVTDARRDVILAGGLYHIFPWSHLPPPTPRSKHSLSQSKERSNEIGPCSASLRIEDPKPKLSKKVNVSNPTA